MYPPAVVAAHFRREVNAEYSVGTYVRADKYPGLIKIRFAMRRHISSKEYEVYCQPELSNDGFPKTPILFSNNPDMNGAVSAEEVGQNLRDYHVNYINKPPVQLNVSDFAVTLEVALKNSIISAISNGGMWMSRSIRDTINSVFSMYAEPLKEMLAEEMAFIMCEDGGLKFHIRDVVRRTLRKTIASHASAVTRSAMNKFMSNPEFRETIEETLYAEVVAWNKKTEI